MSRRTTALLAAAATTATLALPVLPAGAAAASGSSCAGAQGAGDPFFPYAGNGGYDVQHYALDVDYTPGGNALDATARITARATQPLCRFDLDLRGLHVRSLRVDGQAAAFTRTGAQELVIRPARRITRGATFTVVVRYAGHPIPVIDADGSNDGWTPTPDGAFVASEPQGSPSWFPCNDTPKDKATFDFRITVPKGITAVANGVLTGTSTRSGKTTYRWHDPDPTPTYLTTVTSGRFQVRRTTTPSGVPVYDAVDPSQAAKAWPVLRKLPAIVEEFTRVFGPYPFAAVGAIVDDAPQVGYALETLGKPVFDSAPSEQTLAHELSHQWFGDSVTLRRWPDIWLHEGFATWSSWWWRERSGGPSAAAVFDRLYATPASRDGLWRPPPSRPGQPANLFAGSIYARGAMTLQALREKVGTPTFLRILQQWAARHSGGNASTADFLRLAEGISGRPLASFFHIWLEKPAKPVSW